MCGWTKTEILWSMIEQIGLLSYEIIVWGFDDVFIDSEFCGYLNFDISELVYIAH